MVPMTDYLRWNVEVLFVLAFPFAPLLLAYAVRWRRAAETGAAAMILAIVCRGAIGHIVMPLPDGQTWSLRDIAARSMLDGNVAASTWSLRVAPLVALLGLVTVGALAVLSSTLSATDQRKRACRLGDGPCCWLAASTRCGANDRYFTWCSRRCGH
jgi:hypothetical protein